MVIIANLKENIRVKASRSLVYLALIRLSRINRNGL